MAVFLRPIFLLLLLQAWTKGEKEGADRKYAGRCKLYDPNHKVDNLDFDCQTALFSKYDYGLNGSLYMIFNHDLCSHSNLEPVVAAIEAMHTNAANAEISSTLPLPEEPSPVEETEVDEEEMSCEDDDLYDEYEDEEEDFEDVKRRCLAAKADKAAAKEARIAASAAQEATRQAAADAAAAAAALAHAAAAPMAKIAAVRRGNCSFETKVKVAAASGFDAIVIVNHDNTAFPAGAASHKFRSPIPCLMAGDSLLAVYKEMAGIKENAPDCVPMPAAMLEEYLLAQQASLLAAMDAVAGNGSGSASGGVGGGVGVVVNELGEVISSGVGGATTAATTSNSSTDDASQPSNSTTPGDTESTVGSGNNSSSGVEVEGAVDTKEGGVDGAGEGGEEVALDPSDPLYALKKQLADQEKLVRRMLQSLKEGGISVDRENDTEGMDGVGGGMGGDNGTYADNNHTTGGMDANGTATNSTSPRSFSLFDQLSYTAPLPKERTITYCLPDVVLDPQKMLFMKLQYATTAVYERDTAFDEEAAVVVEEVVELTPEQVGGSGWGSGWVGCHSCIQMVLRVWWWVWWGLCGC